MCKRDVHEFKQKVAYTDLRYRNTETLKSRKTNRTLKHTHIENGQK